MSMQSIAWQLMSEEDYGNYVEEKMSSEIKPHGLFEIWAPDTVAECMEGVLKAGLYERLWELVEEAYGDQEDPETPDTHYGHVFGNDLAKVWHRLTDDEKTKLNELAIKHEESY